MTYPSVYSDLLNRCAGQSEIVIPTDGFWPEGRDLLFMQQTNVPPQNELGS
jgi:hypothetical protein